MSKPDGSAGPHPEEEVGSVADEAVKLFGALSDWAREHGTDLSAGLSGVGDEAARAARDLNDHLATGAEECTYCPICRTVHLVRLASPEVRGHLAVAASSLLQAAAGVLAAAGSPDGHRGARTTDVEHIDLDMTDAPDAEWPEEDDE